MFKHGDSSTLGEPSEEARNIAGARIRRSLKSTSSGTLPHNGVPCWISVFSQERRNETSARRHLPRYLDQLATGRPRFVKIRRSHRHLLSYPLRTLSRSQQRRGHHAATYCTDELRQSNKPPTSTPTAPGQMSGNEERKPNAPTRLWATGSRKQPSLRQEEGASRVSP